MSPECELPPGQRGEPGADTQAHEAGCAAEDSDSRHGRREGGEDAPRTATRTSPTDMLEFEAMLFGRYSLIARKGYGLDRSAYTLLSRLRMSGPMSIGQLSEALGLDISTLNRQTAAMVRVGLAERIPDPEGGMARKFRITDKGEFQLKSERAQSIRRLNAILADWPEAEVAALASYLERFNAAIERYHRRPWPRPGQVAAPAQSFEKPDFR